MSNGGTKGKGSDDAPPQDRTREAPLTGSYEYSEGSGSVDFNRDFEVKNSMPPPPNPNRNGQGNDK